jgi:tetratricopeptide (TPR) repeat protein
MDKLQMEFVDEVLRYYRAFAEESGDDPEALYERAKASRIVAMILLRTAPTPDHPLQARQALLEATAILEKLLQDSPGEPNYTEELALTQMRLATTGPPQGEAQRCFRRSLTLLDDLVRRFHETPRYRFELATCLVNSWHGRSLGRPSESETACRRAVNLLEELSRTPTPDPQYLHLLASAYRNLGETLRVLGRAPEAVENCLKAIGAIEKLGPDAMGLPEYQHVFGPSEWRNVGNMYRTLAQSLGQAGRLEEADSAFARAIRIHEKLVKDFPGTHHYWIALFHDYREQGTLYWTRGRKDQADQTHQRAQELGERMVAAFPPPHGASNEVARFLVACPDPKYRKVRRGVELAAIGTTPTAATEDVWNTLAIGQYRSGDYRAALTTLRHLVRLRPEEHGVDWFLLALVHWQLGDHDRAVTCYRQAVEWTAKNMPGDDELRLFRAEAAELLGIKDGPAPDKKGAPPKE